MEKKYTLSSCLDSEEQEIQRMRKQTKILKESSMNKFNALKTTTQHLERKTFPNCLLFQQEFPRLFGTDVKTFKYELKHNMENLETQLNKETLHEKDSKKVLGMLKTQFQKFFHSKLLKTSNYEYEAREARDTSWAQEIQKRLKRLNERKLQIQEVKALDASSGNTESGGIVSDKGNAKSSKNDCRKTMNGQSYGKESNTSGNKRSRPGNECNEKRNSGNDTYITPFYYIEPMAEVQYTAEYTVFAVEKQHTEQLEFPNDSYVMEKDDSNVTPNSSDMSDDGEKVDQDVEKERVLLASLIEDFKPDINENKKIQKQLKKANTSLTQEINESKIAHQNTKNDIAKEEAELKCKEALGLLAKQKHDFNESAKLQAYKTFKFEKEIKEEMFGDLKYIKSLENEVDELQSDKTEFSKEYDLLLQEYVSNDIMCAILRSFDNIDEQTELQYKRFANLEQHCIEIELALQHEKENSVYENSWRKQPLISGNKEKDLKEQNDSLIAELNRKTLEINYLKAQLQDKTIANAEMHENWNKIKGKGVDTNFGKPSILGKPSLQTIRN
ncbi:hypothetical protein Tco_1507742 [Tanacetum coccineum]